MLQILAYKAIIIVIVMTTYTVSSTETETGSELKKD